MTDLQDALDQIKARAEMASDGPWEADGSLIKSHGRAISQTWGVWWRNDLSLITHARTDVPRLVEAVEAVLEVHSADEFGNCEECGGRDGGEPHPCLTVRFLTEVVTGDDDE